MAGYVGLFRFTPKALENLKELPEAMKRTRSLGEQMGVRVIGIWVTMGRYDVVGIADAPDDKTAARFSLAIASGGLVTTETMRALSEEEFAQVVAKL
jgi:uncharacterized protein with GYD domain